MREWQMLLLRCPSRSFTIVGDRAQARHGFAESWPERLERVGLGQITWRRSRINYRTPEEVMAEAEPVIRAVCRTPTCRPRSAAAGCRVRARAGRGTGLDRRAWLAEQRRGIACVIGDRRVDGPTSRVRSLTPELSKGLEFDLVVLIDPGAFGHGIEGAVDRYVAMTRATQQLVILTSG